MGEARRTASGPQYLIEIIHIDIGEWWLERENFPGSERSGERSINVNDGLDAEKYNVGSAT